MTGLSYVLRWGAYPIRTLWSCGLGESLRCPPGDSLHLPTVVCLKLACSLSTALLPTPFPWSSGGSPIYWHHTALSTESSGWSSLKICPAGSPVLNPRTGLPCFQWTYILFPKQPWLCAYYLRYNSQPQALSLVPTSDFFHLYFISSEWVLPTLSRSCISHPISGASSRNST